MDGLWISSLEADSSRFEVSPIAAFRLHIWRGGIEWGTVMFVDRGVSPCRKGKGPSLTDSGRLVRKIQVLRWEQAKLEQISMSGMIVTRWWRPPWTVVKGFSKHLITSGIVWVAAGCFETGMGMADFKMRSRRMGCEDHSKVVGSKHSRASCFPWGHRFDQLSVQPSAKRWHGWGSLQSSWVPLLAKSCHLRWCCCCPCPTCLASFSWKSSSNKTARPTLWYCSYTTIIIAKIHASLAFSKSTVGARLEVLWNNENKYNIFKFVQQHDKWEKRIHCKRRAKEDFTSIDLQLLIFYYSH